MKKVMKKVLFSIVLMGIVFVSCQKEPKYSCNPEIDEWAKEIVKFNEDVDISELIKLPLSRQRAVFVGMSPEKRIELWRVKLKKEIQKGDLCAEEISLYKGMVEQLTPLVYTDITEKERIESISEEWKQKMISLFSWDEKKIYLYCATWLTEEEYYSAILLDQIQSKGPVTPGVEEKKSCNCRIDMGCGIVGGECNRKADCEVVDNCGMWSMSPCYGLCI